MTTDATTVRHLTFGRQRALRGIGRVSAWTPAAPGCGCAPCT